MNKNIFITINLEKGEMNIYDFGNIKLQHPLRITQGTLKNEMESTDTIDTLRLL